MDSACKVISLCNHKGGVSKTTTTFNLGWKLASQDKRVIMVDADPQCNLTRMVLDLRGPDDLEDFYESGSGGNLMAGLASAFDALPEAIQAVDTITVPGQTRRSTFGKRRLAYRIPEDDIFE